MTLLPELCLPRWKVRALWRLSERDSGHPEGDVKGSPSSFPYGKVSGLDPLPEAAYLSSQCPPPKSLSLRP